jgi:hypothetical protein
LKVLTNGIVKIKENKQLVGITSEKIIDELSETDNKIIKKDTTNSVVDFFAVILIKASIKAEIHAKIKKVVIGNNSYNFKGTRIY